MPLYMKMSQNISKTRRHLKFCYISILTNLLRIYVVLYVVYYIISRQRVVKLIHDSLRISTS